MDRVGIIYVGRTANYNFNTEEPFIDLIDAKQNLAGRGVGYLSQNQKKTKRNRLTDLFSNSTQFPPQQ
jgi:hypothetical protein